jgi:hypothetical protein
MTSWIKDEKFSMGMQFLFGTSSFTAAHDDDLEHPTQQKKEWCTTMILSTRLKNKKRDAQRRSALSSLGASRTQ